MRHYRCDDSYGGSFTNKRQRRKQNVELKKLLYREVIVARRFAEERFKEDVPLEEVEYFCYLGSIIDGKSGKARPPFTQLWKVWRAT